LEETNNKKANVKRNRVKGYIVAIIIKKIDGLYYASAPGIGSIFIEEKSAEKALELAKNAVTSIIDARLEMGNEITEDNEYLEVIYDGGEEPVLCRSDFYVPSRKTPRKAKRNVVAKSQ
jgi:predicted RNase H-like HicB family nuclease